MNGTGGWSVYKKGSENKSLLLNRYCDSAAVHFSGEDFHFAKKLVSVILHWKKYDFDT